jgi:hypothetical protein
MKNAVIDHGQYKQNSAERNQPIPGPVQKVFIFSGKAAGDQKGATRQVQLFK